MKNQAPFSTIGDDLEIEQVDRLVAYLADLPHPEPRLAPGRRAAEPSVQTAQRTFFWEGVLPRPPALILLGTLS